MIVLGQFLVADAILTAALIGLLFVLVRTRPSGEFDP